MRSAAHRENECERCADLEERVAYLEEELGLQRNMNAIVLIQDFLKETPRLHKASTRAPAILVAALYQANGKIMTRTQIEEAIPSVKSDSRRGFLERDPKIIDVWVCLARCGLGKSAILTAPRIGYKLSPFGMDRVNAILENRKLNLV